ncbi:MAG: hypothetical protein KKG47_01765 [Proteobacteria bacterium]|nr:hypothetical protein [Pseudomonadota bacterium]MBU1737303.1 hypothetical protein [Pseudomonadota bacterium]
MLQGAKQVYVAKGKKIAGFADPGVHQEEILENAIGRSGSLRAPTLRVGNMFIIGFNEGLYREFLVGLQ